MFCPVSQRCAFLSQRFVLFFSLWFLLSCTTARENRFEWIVQGALDVLARANESGELTKPRPARSGSPQRMRPSPTPPARAKKGEAYNDVMEC